MWLTRRGLAVLAFAVVGYSAGEAAGYPLFRALAAIALGAVVAGVLVTVRRPEVDVRRELYPDRVECGRPALARLLVRNPGTRRQPGFTARERVEGGDHVGVTVRPLAAGAQAPYNYQLPTPRRGRFAVGPLILERTDPFGLVRRSLTTGDTTMLWVYPHIHPARAPIGGRPRHHHEGQAADKALRGSADLLKVREYVLGDEVRHLHWKATARTGRLMVRDYVDPDQPRFTLLLDTRPSVQSCGEFEEAVELAASLVSASALAGRRCRLLTSCGREVAAHGGALAVRRLLDLLCEVGQDARADTMIPAALSTSATRGGCLVVVTGRLRAANLRELTLQQPYFSSMFVLGVGPTGLGMEGHGVRRLAGVPKARTISAADAAEAVRQWNVVVS